MSKLREHWQETNSRVLSRKAELDAMLADCERWGARRRDVESWLTKMETRMQKMQPVAHTVDVLEQQLREQKVIILCSKTFSVKQRCWLAPYRTRMRKINIIVQGA